MVLTGYSSEPGQTGALCFDRDSGESKAVQTPREPQDFSGTGDLFASVLAGGVARGVPLFRPPKPLRILSVIALRAPWPRDSQSRMA